jgi:hypothetical protein
VLVESGEAAVRGIIDAAVNADLFSTEWRAGLLCTDDGDPRAVLANAMHALRNAPEWKGVLWHNDFATSNREHWQPQMEGGKAGRELPGIVDQVISMSLSVGRRLRPVPNKDFAPQMRLQTVRGVGRR